MAAGGCSDLSFAVVKLSDMASAQLRPNRSPALAARDIPLRIAASWGAFTPIREQNMDSGGSYVHAPAA
jgi:hypothetical protein